MCVPKRFVIPNFSLQTSFVTLDEVIKATNRRVNAIEHVIIPKYERTVRNHFPALITAYLDRLYHLRARRVRERRVLPSQKGAGKEEGAQGGPGRRTSGNFLSKKKSLKIPVDIEGARQLQRSHQPVGRRTRSRSSFLVFQKFISAN